MVPAVLPGSVTAHLHLLLYFCQDFYSQLILQATEGAKHHKAAPLNPDDEVERFNADLVFLQKLLREGPGRVPHHLVHVAAVA